jgi:hypothetical protein
LLFLLLFAAEYQRLGLRGPHKPWAADAAANDKTAKLLLLCRCFPLFSEQQTETERAERPREFDCSFAELS